ncbi:uncharacterized protein LOC117742947 isoform X2 [Cyclopterus lumpus]|uniref:uncharacterized protein LOC117742947 isoform X2 n=1 Tax=Cyclopterus lumpus TaxID=8103 RepID=UPI001485E5C4|nr:uncharacterized protein LOC117742947 isoform X2 [Cyclopterus lumpus]
MRPDCCPIILRVSIFVALVLTLDADDEHPDCEVEVKVRQNTVYEAVVGEELRINCTVEFCSDAPPPVSWFTETTQVCISVKVEEVAATTSTSLSTVLESLPMLQRTTTRCLRTTSGPSFSVLSGSPCLSSSYSLYVLRRAAGTSRETPSRPMMGGPSSHIYENIE